MDGYVTGAELGEFLHETVLNYSHGSQTPQYGKMRDPVLDKGDFVFKVATSSTLPKIPISETKSLNLIAEVVITSDKAGAEVFFDGVRQGITPNLFPLPAEKSIIIEVRLDGYFAREEVTLGAKEVRELDFILKRETANLFLRVDNPGSYQLVVDGEEMGYLSNSGLVRDIGAGVRKIELIGDKAYWKGLVAIKSGTETTIVDVVPWAEESAKEGPVVIQEEKSTGVVEKESQGIGKIEIASSSPAQKFGRLILPAMIPGLKVEANGKVLQTFKDEKNNRIVTDYLLPGKYEITVSGEYPFYGQKEIISGQDTLLTEWKEQSLRFAYYEKITAQKRMNELEAKYKEKKFFKNLFFGSGASMLLSLIIGTSASDQNASEAAAGFFYLSGFTCGIGLIGSGNQPKLEDIEALRLKIAKLDDAIRILELN